MTGLAWLIIGCCALLAGCKGHGLDERDYTDDGVQWGKAVNGLQVGLARRTYELGKAPGYDQIYFVVTLRNVGKEPMNLLAPLAIGGVLPEKAAGNESVSVKLIYDSAAGLKTAAFKPAKKPVVQVMEPGKSYNLEARLTAGKFGLERFLPGRLTAAYANDQATIKYDSIAEPVTGLWTGEAKSGVVMVEVSEPRVPQKSDAPKQSRQDMLTPASAQHAQASPLPAGESMAPGYAHFLGGMGNGTPLPVRPAKAEDTGKRVHLPMPPTDLESAADHEFSSNVRPTEQISGRGNAK